ncbi:hypothetical protein D3227_37540 [Mesorhizobium waimense]|uniref:Uncharacterized protein n=1 Tax=Mesorhizobium waimense TaxID=1300307 RepID=A0A3A5JVL5_9HYPH|nr:hypothetical protein [Mesorhizobium waimense]RJT26119.1 hypothetical protein D3227_37540 [Mesorhizobium waimense]
MAEHYCDYLYKHLPAFRLVIPKDGPMPPATTADDWQLVRNRSASQLSVDGRDQVDSEGYAIIRVNVTLGELLSL